MSQENKNIPDSPPETPSEGRVGLSPDALFSTLWRRTNGAIKCAIDAHGSITMENHSSAGKRVAAQVLATLKELGMENGEFTRPN